MSSKRLITKNEIEDILSFIKPQGSIPIEAAKSIVNENKKQLREQLKSLKIYPQVLPSLKLMIEQQYMEAKIQAGESVGVIGAQSIGEKQTQTTLNSVDYTDKILYILNDKAIVEPVGKMIDNILEKNKEHIKLYQNNNTEYLELPEGYFIPSGDENGYNEWLRIEAVTRHLPNGKLVKVTTQSGRNVMASQSKSFLVWNGEKFVDTLGSEVKIGDILPTTKNMPMVKNQTKYFDMYTIFPKDKYLYSTEVIKAKNCKEKYPCDWFSRCNGKDFITPYKRPDTLFGKRKDFYMEMMPGFVYIHTSNKFVSHIPEKILLDNNFGFLIGIYLAEGWCTKTFVGVSNNDEVIRKRVTDFCDCYGVTYHLVTSKGKNVRNGTSNDLKIHSTLLARMFKIICDTGSANKFVPDFAYTAPKEFITGLIDGYFSGDGCVTKTGSITVSSVSEQLIQGISFLLSYMGIFGKFSSFQQKKNNVGSQNIKRAYILDIRNCFAQKFAKEIKMTEGNKQKRLEQITLKKIYRYKCGRIQEKYPKDRDVYFDTIVNIEFVEATNGLVYDFTISKTKNFNLFNGLAVVDTFHKAGSGEKTITTGVPRIEELLNATKDPKSVNCIAFMKDKHKSISDIRQTIGHNIVEISFKKISKSYKIMVNKSPEKWYESFKILYGDEFTQFSDCISIKIDMDILYEYKLDLEIITKIISEKYSDMICVFSPDNIGQIDIFVDTSDINLPDNRVLFINSENVKEIYLEEVVQPTLYNIIICGIPGIKNIYFNDDENSFETDGSNFQELLGLPFIDSTKTISNNVWDIYNTLGVEATRQFLIEEFMSIMEGINRCHIQLLSEKMTFNGSISSISRYTMRNEECGPMGKASFEETMDNFLKAGLYGEQEETKGVSASIICGKIAHIGSGVCELIMDIKALPNHIPVLSQIVEEKSEQEAYNINAKYSEKKKSVENEEPVEVKKKKKSVKKQQMLYLDL